MSLAHADCAYPTQYVPLDGLQAVTSLGSAAGAHRVINNALHIIDNVGDIEHDAEIAHEALGGARGRVHVVARRERVRMRQCRKKHLHADQKLLQARCHVVHVISGPVLRHSTPQEMLSVSSITPSLQVESRWQ